MRGSVVLQFFLACCAAVVVQGAPQLQILSPASNGWVRLSSAAVSNTLVRVEASSNLINWQAIATTHDGLFNYPDAASPKPAQRFYRLRSETRRATNDWKNQLIFPEEAFESAEFQAGGVRWVKFAILLDDPVRVIYQHSTNYLFHYDFATRRIPQFAGMDRRSFDAISLRRTNQQVVLGAVLYPPHQSGPGTGPWHEFGIQFVGLDPYPPDDVARWFELVRATVYSAAAAGVYYMPSFEQRASAETNRSFFEGRGIPIGAIERWVNVNHCYSAGWALGRLKYFPSTEIDAAFADGRLQPTDILLTDGVPAETPLVAGIISLTPATPNSHVAILAASFGIPFVHFPDEAEQRRIQQLVGREVVLRVFDDFRGCQAKVVDAEGVLDPAQRTEVLGLKRAQPIQFRPKGSFGAISASTDTLTPADIQYFGGKAANYGLLRRSVPTNCPIAIALSFDLWDAFLDQTLPGGQTLRAEIATRLARYTNYPPDIVSLKTNLAGIRDMIRNTARFTLAQQQAITNALTPFNPNRKIRFRSSTNVEDGEHFTGAGLYDSYSGCLLDDRDGDTIGPSHCDPQENGERGVSRAIQRVYASFYNGNAFLERLRHGVDESKVGMGVLVHHSFPDEEELANGVATLQFSINSSFTNATGDLVTQFGATPVTNPDGTAAPEVVRTSRYNQFTDLSLVQPSSLVPLGAYTMSWQSDYLRFMDLFTAVAYRFKQFYPAKTTSYLDFEYKKDVNLGLVVKQVREIPHPNATNEVVAFLLNEPTEYCVAQEEFGDVFANHRLKSLWALETASLRLGQSNLTQSIYRDGTIEYIVNGTRQTLSGPMSSWPNASNHLSAARDSWTTGSGNERRAWQLDTTIIPTVTGSRPPIITQQDLQRTVTVAYARPVQWIDDFGAISTRTNEVIRLRPCAQLEPVILRQLTLARTNAGKVVRLETSYYWPKAPAGPSAGYTAPLVHFVETRITGLTTNAIVLRDYYSQTYRPGHHNFSEDFIFEPRLELNLPAATLNELNAANIQFLYMHRPSDGLPVFVIQGLNGVLRNF